MKTSGAAEDGGRFENWIPLNLEGKPLYHGINETDRMNKVRPNITLVRKQWNDVRACQALIQAVEKTLNSVTLSRELRSELHAALSVSRYWIDFERSSDVSERSSSPQTAKLYGALELYTKNAGYKNIYGHINQLFRVEEIDESMIKGATALVEILTIDLYNLRLDNFGRAKYYNFQGIVHRGMKVSTEILNAFRALLEKKLEERNFSVPLTFLSTSIGQKQMQEFLDNAKPYEKKLHLKIHVEELDPNLLASYREEYPDSIVSTICAMPISSVSEYPNEQEVLLRGPSFQLLRMYEEGTADHSTNVLEVVMLNANRDHGTELAHHHGKYEQQRRLFGQMCAATKYKFCAAFAKEHGQAEEAEEYNNLWNEKIEKIGPARTRSSLITANYNIWATPRPSWIGASLTECFPTFYVQRRNAFSKALFSGQDWNLVERIIEDEYEWQKSDWCNVPRLYVTKEDAKNSSGFTALHQAAFNNASVPLVQKLISLGGWRTMKAHERGGFRTAKEVAMERKNYDLVALLEPQVHHELAVDVLRSIETYMHKIMNELAGDAIDRFAVRLPQLSVLTELDVEAPSLWFPIPGISGGFVITLFPKVVPYIHLVYVSNVFPKTEKEFWINPKGHMREPN